jgi:hypothetical protein
MSTTLSAAALITLICVGPGDVKYTITVDLNQGKGHGLAQLGVIDTGGILSCDHEDHVTSSRCDIHSVDDHMIFFGGYEGTDTGVMDRYTGRFSAYFADLKRDELVLICKPAKPLF